MDIPEYVLHNSKVANGREWKSKKRKEARELRRQLGELRTGCAFFPGGPADVEIISQAIDRIVDDLSVKNWGR